MTQQNSQTGLGSHTRKWLALAALCAMPLGVAAAFAADPAAPKSASAPAATKAATTGATSDKKEQKKEDPKAWKVAEGWKFEILAQNPVIHHPSVLYPAPDGRIFLAEDPMDMSGSSKEPHDRIIVIHPDGHITTFAENLYAVFGLQYIDGKLYVHHTPKLSVFTDVNSVGVDRVDLIDSDNPAPNVNGSGFNDHIPSNIRLAMDGYLYMTTGDKGIFAESNVDHRKAVIQGGGILRIRPDGTEMEVFATGTRNHLDAAINEEDELFTYDNTDDGLGWWTRFSHMVDGGYYGYPYDYRPPENDKEAMPAWNAQKQALDKAKQEWEKANKDKPEAEKTPKPAEGIAAPFKPWTLWRIEEYAGGSPTGSVAYNEDALPGEFHGNIFNSEWGKADIERIAIARAGGSYKVLKREIILKGGPTPLRPVGIQVTADGSGILVADWNYDGWRNATTDRGRLIKLTYTGKLSPMAKPSWYVAAAQGQKCEASTPELIGALAHPAQSVRLVAQRRIAERGGEAIAPLIALLNNAKAPNHARWHAIWTLDRIDSGKSARDAIVAIVKDVKTDPTVRMQAARQLGTRGAREGVAALLAALNEEDEALRFRAATALGRIGDVAAIPPLIEKLNDKDLFTHFAIFTALNRIGRANSAAWEQMVPALGNEQTEIREGVALAMRATYDPVLARLLATFASTNGKPAAARAAAITVLAPLQKLPKPWVPTQTELKWWGTMPARNPAPRKEIEWDGTKIVMDAIRSALADEDTVIRHAAVQALRFAPDPSANEALAKMFESDTDVSTRKAIFAALAAAKAPGGSKLVDQILSQAKQNGDLVTSALETAEATGGGEMTAVLLKFVAADNKPEHLAAALETLAKLPDVKSIPVLLKRLSDPHGNVINAAAKALGAINDDQSVTAVAPLLKDKRAEVKRGAANALADIKRDSARDPLLAVWQDPDVQKEAILALAARPDIKAIDAYIEGCGSTDGNVRNKSKHAIEQLHEKALPLIEARLDTNPPPARAVIEMQQVFERFVPQNQRTGKLYKFDTKALSPEAFLTYAKSHRGDAGNGKKIFMDQNGAGCIKCHKIGNDGGDVGPSLAGVGGKYPREFLIDSILYPSKQILDGYQQTMIKRKSNGSVEFGIARGETETEVTLVDSGDKKIVIKKDDIATRKVSQLSLMPENLQTAWKPEEFVDVVAFLESLKDQAKEPGKK